MISEQEYRAFDAATDADQFRKREPYLAHGATSRQRELAAKYTRISFTLVPNARGEVGYEPDATHAWLLVGGQGFCVTRGRYCDTRDEASWHCWMIAKALEKVIEAETHKGSN